MAFDPVLLGRTQALLSEKRAARAARLSLRRAEVYKALPAVREIDEEMQSGLLRAVRDTFAGKAGAEDAMERCRERNLALRARRDELLVENNYPLDTLEDTPDCLKCGDTGTADGHVCDCLRRLYAEAQAGALSRKLDITGQSFDTFDIELFSPEPDPIHGLSPRDNMGVIHEFCGKYAQRFGPDSPDLFFRGGAGLGKTFLCACIAGILCERGHWVRYDTAAGAFALMEAEKFNRDEAAADEARDLFECELLILDDLGAEFVTPFTQAAFYQLLNARLNARRKTILVSGLTEEELRRRYQPQLISRMESFALLPFFGPDLRRR